MLKIFFGFFLTIGMTFTAGMSAIIPMEERKGGLRHMQHLFGLNSLEYFTGMFLGDAIISGISATIIAIILICYRDIIELEYVPHMFLLFWVFGCTLNTFSYFFSHVFSDPQTGIKYIALVYSVGLLIGPLVATTLIAPLIGEGKGTWRVSMNFFYFVSPLFTFWLTAMNLCFKGSAELRPFEVAGGYVPGLEGGVGVLSYQLVIIGVITIVIDHFIRNSYKKRGGKDGEQPPHLEVHDDVKEHEE